MLRQGRELFELGARLARLGTLAVGSAGGEEAKLLARAAGCGAALAGGEVRFHDGTCAACGAWLAGFYGFGAALFLRQEGEEIRLYLHDGAGRAIDRGPLPAAGSAGAVGSWDLLAGADCAWAAHRAGGRPARGGVAFVRGPAALTMALERMGWAVTRQPLPGGAVFTSDDEGFTLTVERGGAVSHPAGADALEAAAGYGEEPRAIPAFGPGWP